LINPDLAPRIESLRIWRRYGLVLYNTAKNLHEQTSSATNLEVAFSRKLATPCHGSGIYQLVDATADEKIITDGDPGPPVLSAAGCRLACEASTTVWGVPRYTEDQTA
jgi:hypothetical protein